MHMKFGDYSKSCCIGDCFIREYWSIMQLLANFTKNDYNFHVNNGNNDHMGTGHGKHFHLEWPNIW